MPCTSKIEDNSMIPEGTLIRVNHYQEKCTGFIQQKYYLVQEGDGIDIENWSLLYDEIEDFKFILGYIYDLDVNIIERNPVPQDIGKYRYVLIQVLSKKEVND
jgi:hypothetical protein